MTDFKAADDSEEEDDYSEDEDFPEKIEESKNENIDEDKREKETSTPLGLKQAMNGDGEVALSAIKQSPQIDWSSYFHHSPQANHTKN